MKVNCSLLRSLGQPLQIEDALALKAYMKSLLSAMTRIKIRDNCPRPHYTPQETHDIQYELGLGVYDAAVYYCRNCGATRAKGIKLFECGKCHQAWFCSKECITSSWKNKNGGHKEECKHLQTQVKPSFVQKCTKEELDMIKRPLSTGGQGFVVLPDFMVACYDRESGEIFESITNRTLFK